MSVNLAVAFVVLYDLIERIPVIHLDDWAAGSAHQQRAADVAESAARGRLTLPDVVTDPREAFAIAAGLYSVLTRADPLIDADPPPALIPYRMVLAGTHNLLPDLERGALIPCRVTTRRRTGGPVYHRDLFPGLRRIDSETFRRTGWVRLPRLRDLSTGKDLRIAAVPFLSERDDVRFATHRAGRYYSTSPSSADLLHHVPGALAALDASGAQLAVMPEACLDDELLRAWQDACRNIDPKGALRFILIGTGPVTVGAPGCLLAGEFNDDELGTLPHNRAVLIERSTGEVLLVQDKQHPFSMYPEYRRRVPVLIGREKSVKDIDSATLNEYVPNAYGLNVLDSRRGRIAVFICEDLGHVAEAGAHAFRVGVDLVLAPILAPPILPNRWQQKAGEQLSPDGIDVIVSNSLAFGRQDLDPDNRFAPRPGVPAASLVAITGSPEPVRQPKEDEGLPAVARDDGLKVRVVII